MRGGKQRAGVCPGSCYSDNTTLCTDKDTRHGFLTTYLPGPTVVQCLHLSCTSLTTVHCKAVVRLEEHDLATTLEHPNIARHFTHFLQIADQEYQHPPQQVIFGFASVFQLYLDLFALVFKHENPREPPTFPASPGQRLNYRTGEWDLGRQSDRWRKRVDMRRSICEEKYWVEHPLLSEGWTSPTEDDEGLSNIFREARSIIRAMPGTLLDTRDDREFSDEEWDLIDRLRGLLPQIAAELRYKHGQFKLQLRNKQAVAHCCVIL